MARAGQAAIEHNGGSRQLIIFAHGLRRGREHLAHVRSIARQSYPDADHFAPMLPLKLLRTGDASEVATDLLDQISRLVATHDGSSGSDYEQIIFVGHSAGAVLIRAVWCLAHGAQPDGTIRADKASPWANRVTRLVLLAAVNRGFSTTIAMSPWLRLQFAIGAVIEALTGPRWTMLGFRRGAPFLTRVRLQTLALNRLMATPPIIIQILGTVDDFVSPNDNIDLLSGANFYYLTAANSGHATVLDADAVTPEGRERRNVIGTALSADRKRLAVVAETAEDLQGLYQDSPDDFDEPVTSGSSSEKRVDHVVFVIHGIRDYGFWTKKLAAEIKRHGHTMGLNCRSVTSTYGFFPMGPFLVPPARRRKMEWLLDEYVHARALYPDSDFSCVAHSNGTFLLAAALDCCEAIKFDRVAFAGSVVRRDFDWDRAIKACQIKQAINYCATGDWVVAIFPNFFQPLRWFGIGSAGHNGFLDRAKALPPELTQVEYVEGAHDAAIREVHWREIATFILEGRREPGAMEPTKHSPLIGLLGHAPWLVIAVVLFLFVMLPLQLILAPLGVRLFGRWLVYCLPSHLLWLPAVALVIYVWALRKVLTQL